MVWLLLQIAIQSHRFRWRDKLIPKVGNRFNVTGVIFVIFYFLADTTDCAGDGSQIAIAILMPNCFKDLLLCKQFARMLCHQTQNAVFIAAHIHLRSVLENTVVFQVDLQTGTSQNVCGIPHQIKPFKNRLLLRWAVILRDANNNFNFLHTIANPPPKPNLYHSIWKIGCSSHFRIDRALRCRVF